MQPHEDDDADRIFDPETEKEESANERVEALEREEVEEEEQEGEREAEQDPVGVASHYEQVLGAAKAALEDRDLESVFEVATALSEDERAAVRVLAKVARGRNEHDEKLIYAEERLAMLNQALAMLQPVLALGLRPELVELRESFDDLVLEVSELEDKLARLADAQEEMFQQDREGVAEAPDTDDKPEPPEEVEEGERKSTLFEGPEVAEEPERPSTLSVGEAVPDKPVTKSTAWDGE